MHDRKQLKLKVTVEADDPDAVLNRILCLSPIGRKKLAKLKYSRESIDVTKIARADGQDIGLEAEFEEYWSENRLEGETDESDEKTWARDAFMYGVKHGKRIA